MYGYFAFNYLGVKIIQPMLLTVIQIVQMYWGLCLNFILMFNMINTGKNILEIGVIYNLTFGTLMYGYYLYLFCNFFQIHR